MTLKALLWDVDGTLAPRSTFKRCGSWPELPANMPGAGSSARIGLDDLIDWHHHMQHSLQFG